MIYRNGLTIHETPTHEVERPLTEHEEFLVRSQHPAGLTCGHCGAQFNTGSALGSHKTSTHYPLPYLLSDWGEVLEEMK